jgi:penicillin-binding protein 2
VHVPVFFILLIQLLNLQILKGEQYRSLSENNFLETTANPPLRGHIFDRDGRLLVDNRPAFDLYIIPADVNPAGKLRKNLPGISIKAPKKYYRLLR